MRKFLTFSFLIFTIVNAGAQYFMLEDSGLLVVEFEEISDTKAWDLAESQIGLADAQFLVWRGSEYFSTPGNQQLNYQFIIKNPGTYRFLWHSKVGKGDSPTEHNDTWLRFPDAADFYGKQSGGSIVHPHGDCSDDCPNGSGSQGWFKVYSSGTTNWTWITRTSDNNAHQIYVKFHTAGTYTAQISARSAHHRLNRFVLYKEGLYNQSQVTGIAVPASDIIPFKVIPSEQVFVKDTTIEIGIEQVHKDIDTIFAYWDNPGLIDSIAVFTQDSGRNYKLVLALIRDSTGTSLINLYAVSSSGDTMLVTISLKVIPFINQAPTLDSIPDYYLTLDQTTSQLIRLKGIADGNSGSQALTVKAGFPFTSGFIITTPIVSYINGEDTANIAYDLKGPGMATIHITVSDDGGTDLGGKNSITRSYNIYVTSSTDISGIKEPSNGNYIYPNPANQTLHVVANTADRLCILNTTGQILYEDIKLSRSNLIDITSLKAGTYFLIFSKSQKHLSSQSFQIIR